MVTKRQETGEKGEKYVIKHCKCPKCKTGKFTDMSIKNFPCADLICKFCGQLVQVKAKNVRKKSEKIKTISGAKWSPFKQRIEKGIFYPLYIVKIYEDKPFEIIFISDHIQKELCNMGEDLYIPRKPLGAHCKRAGWQGFYYDLEVIPEKLIRKIK